MVYDLKVTNMNDIPIYKEESSIAGLAEQIKSQSSVAYVSQLEPASSDMQKTISKAIASLGDDDDIVQRISASHNDSDLYFTKSILVTTTWNKNADIFAPEYTWAARHTPSHKPTNLEHDEKRLVGHIVNCWPIDAKGTVIQDNCTIDDLPEKFHLVTGAVIYKGWEDEALIDRTEALIQEIEAGTKFVSMEVLFTDFDYGILRPDGSYHTKARNEDSAWMTKHLRQYGGTGSYEDYQIGRVLKNMTFSGKGYVDKPANPESIIFSTNDNNFSFTSASEKNVVSEENGVSNLLEGKESSLTNEQGDFNMTDTIYKEQAAKLEKTLAELEGKLAEANDKLSKAGIEKYTSQIEELTAKAAALETEKTDLHTSLEEAQAKVATATEQLDAEKTAKAELETKLAEITEAEAKANRVSTLVDGGITKETATEKVDTFANLSDEQFSVIATELINASKAQATTETPTEETSEGNEEVPDEEVDEAEASEEVLEEVETEEETTDLSVATETEIDDQTDLRNELQQAIAAHLGCTLNKENE